MNNEQPSYYMVITANVWGSREIKDWEKLLYGHITTLQQKDGVCYASNRYFAELLGKSLGTISKGISSLKKAGFIEVDLVYKKNSNEIDKRLIYLSNNIVRKVTIDNEEKSPSIDHKNNPHIKKQIVNTDINTDIKLINEHFENVWKLYPKKLGKGKILKKAKMGIFLYSLEQWKIIISRYDKSVGDKQYLMHGSTFFNSGYVDFIDENYDVTEISCKPSGGNKTKNHTPDKWTGDQNFPW